jgi:hypothetical protein
MLPTPVVSVAVVDTAATPVTPDVARISLPTKPVIAYVSAGFTLPYTLVALAAVTAKGALVMAAAVVRVAAVTT